MPRLARFAAFAASAASLAREVAAFRATDTTAGAAVEQSVWALYDQAHGPNFKDVAQGQLGDCYYLAGLAALAKTHPETLREAFVTKGETNSLDRSVYKLRFLIDGEERIVAIDDAIPMLEKPGYDPSFYFARLASSEEAWPALLEKGFAKLFGSYFAIRGGWGFQTFKAITQSPVDVVYKDQPETLWKFVEEAHRNGWPVTGGTQANDFGTAAGHVYVILSTGVKEGKEAVEVYNPWGTKNNYDGKLKHLSTRSVGDYWMTKEEFGQAFNMLSRARVLPKAQLSSIKIKVGEATAISFTTSPPTRLDPATAAAAH